LIQAVNSCHILGICFQRLAYIAALGRSHFLLVVGWSYHHLGRGS
jgi:hypothetical protein